MKPDRNIILLDYLDGQLSPEARWELEQELAESPELQAELESLRHTLAGLSGALPDELPGPGLQARFSRFLEEEKSTASAKTGLHFLSRRYGWAWTAAAALALLVVGTGFGLLLQHNASQQKQIDQLVAEIDQTRKMMVLSMLQEPSASKRIKALHTVQEEKSGPDPQVVRALVNTLNTDDNVNVRVKAAEALLHFADRPGVLAALVNSLDHQESPEVQITLIEVLVAIEAKGALPKLHNLMEDEKVIEVVRNKAAAGIEQLM